MRNARRFFQAAWISAAAVMLVGLPGTLEAQGPAGLLTFCSPIDYSNATPQTTGLFTDLRRGPQINDDYANCRLNFTGSVGSASDMWITLLGAPGSPKDIFSNVKLTADVEIHRFDNRKGIGFVALYDDATKKGLFFAVYDNGNTDGLTLSVFNGATGQLTSTLKTVFLASQIHENVPYALRFQLAVSGDSFHVDGSVQPTSLGTLSFDGSLSASGLSAAGQVGIGGWAKSAFVDSSVTTFEYSTPPPVGRAVTITNLGTVNINDLPPPVVGGGGIEADNFEPGPHIDEPPGMPGPPAVGSAISLSPPHAVTRNGLRPSSARAIGQVNDETLMEPIEFNGLANANSKVPPDIQIAAGNTRIVEMVNVSGAEYGKLAGNLIKSFDLGSLFLTNTGQGTDPRVLFDADTHTFFAAYELKTAGGDDIRLAVSDEPGDTWTIYDVRSNNVDTCFDQPKLGFGTGVVTLSWNDYKNASSCSSLPASNFTGSEYIVVQKLGLLARFASVSAVIWGPDAKRFQVVPVQSLSPSAIQYAAYHNTGGKNFNVMAFEGIPGIFDVSFSENSYDIGNVSGPPNARQPAGGNPNLQTNDDRLLSAVWLNDNLWGAFNEGCTPQGDTTSRSCERFVEVSTASNSVSQNVQLQSNGQDLYFAALTLSGTGDLFFGMTFSSSTLNPSAVVLGVPGAAFGPVTGGINYQPGTAVYNVTDGAMPPNFINRWGDYSGAAKDPNDSTLCWVGQQYSAGDWATAIAAVFFGETPPPPPH